MTSHTTTNALVSFLFLFLWAIPVRCSLPSEFSIAGYAPGSNATGHALELFEQWRIVHHRVYRDPAEKARGFENFLVNIEYVLGWNSRKATHSPSHAVGLNRFADLSNEEFKAKYLSRIPRVREMRRGRVERGEVYSAPWSCEAPTSLDWRKKGVVTAVKDQGDCGELLSCFTFKLEIASEDDTQFCFN